MGFKKMLDKSANWLLGVSAISMGAFAFQSKPYALIISVIFYLMALILCHLQGDD